MSRKTSIEKVWDLGFGFNYILLNCTTYIKSVLEILQGEVQDILAKILYIKDIKTF